MRGVAVFIGIVGGLALWLGIHLASSPAGAVCGAAGMTDGDQCLHVWTGETTSKQQQEESNTTAKHVIGYVIAGVGGFGALIGVVGVVDIVASARRKVT